MTKQFAFYVDTSACCGCKVCQVACQEKNDLPTEILWRRVFQYSGGKWMRQGTIYVPNQVFRYYFSTSCQHCQDPLCVKVCPTTAMHKREDGIVLIDPATCIGCRYCEWACPYGAPRFDEEKDIMTKCDFCQDLLAKDGRPACVDACVTRCLEFGELDDLRARHGNLDAIEPLPKSDITQPSLVITPHRHAQESGEGTGRITNMPEEL